MALTHYRRAMMPWWRTGRYAILGTHFPPPAGTFRGLWRRVSRQRLWAAVPAALGSLTRRPVSHPRMQLDAADVGGAAALHARNVWLEVRFKRVRRQRRLRRALVLGGAFACASLFFALPRVPQSTLRTALFQAFALLASVAGVVGGMLGIGWRNVDWRTLRRSALSSSVALWLPAAATEAWRTAYLLRVEFGAAAAFGQFFAFAASTFFVIGVADALVFPFRREAVVAYATLFLLQLVRLAGSWLGWGLSHDPIAVTVRGVPFRDSELLRFIAIQTVIVLMRGAGGALTDRSASRALFLLRARPLRQVTAVAAPIVASRSAQAKAGVALSHPHPASLRVAWTLAVGTLGAAAYVASIATPLSALPALRWTALLCGCLACFAGVWSGVRWRSLPRLANATVITAVCTVPVNVCLDVIRPDHTRWQMTVLFAVMVLTLPLLDLQRVPWPPRPRLAAVALVFALWALLWVDVILLRRDDDSTLFTLRGRSYTFLQAKSSVFSTLVTLNARAAWLAAADRAGDRALYCWDRHPRHMDARTVRARTRRASTVAGAIMLSNPAFGSPGLDAASGTESGKQAHAPLHTTGCE